MSHQIGTDEAGYGPNLGPLTIAGTLWHVVNQHDDLYQQLATSVTPVSADATAKKLLISDSKVVHSGKHALRRLELSVLAIATSLLGYVPSDWVEFATALGTPSIHTALSEQPWMLDRKLTLPVMADVSKIQMLADCFSAACNQARVSLQGIHCTPVFPNRFNQELVAFGNKATLLSTRTLKIVRELLNRTDAEVFIGCDKHGGRSKYTALIEAHLTSERVTIERESLAVSDYRFREGNREIKLQFLAKGESYLPTAVSSMVAKYMRETMMLMWNDYWKEHVPGIKPTKGYPLDAKRFKREIAIAQSKLGIEDDIIWRRS